MPATIGDVVRRLRRAKGLQQQDVVSQSGGEITQTWLAKLETGRVRYSNPEMLAILARILGTSVSEIYRGAGIEIAPVAPTVDPEVARIMRLLQQMTTEEKIKFLEFLEARYPTPDTDTPTHRESAPAEQSSEQKRRR